LNILTSSVSPRPGSSVPVHSKGNTGYVSLGAMGKSGILGVNTDEGCESCTSKSLGLPSDNKHCRGQVLNPLQTNISCTLSSRA